MKVSFAMLALFSFLTFIVEMSSEVLDVLILIHMILSMIFFKQHDSSLFCSYIFNDESDLHKKTILLRQAHHQAQYHMFVAIERDFDCINAFLQKFYLCEHIFHTLEVNQRQRVIFLCSTHELCVCKRLK